MKTKKMYECGRCKQEFEEPSVDTLGMQVCPNCGHSGILPTEKYVEVDIHSLPPTKKNKKNTTRAKAQQLKMEP